MDSVASVVPTVVFSASRVVIVVVVSGGADFLGEVLIVLNVVILAL